jgi:arylsulfatase A-like enzyme
MSDINLEPGMLSSQSFDRRTLLKACGAAGVSALASEALAATKKSPFNILFIVADDLGYADLSCFGRRDYETPFLDNLARQGLRFTSAYANSPVCSATRTGLITGRYQYRLPVGLEEPVALRDVGLPSQHPTLPSLLKKAGYATALLGKWHLGRLPKFDPIKSGYDHFFGFRNGGIDYYSHDFAGQPDLWDGDAPVEAAGYLTDLLGNRCIDLMNNLAAASSPFLISLHFNAPHWPWEAIGDKKISEELALRRDPLAMLHYDGGTMATYAAMVQRLDMQVGRVIGQLETLGIAENTIVVFTSDNGGERFSDTWPFTGRKTELLEGGIRVPQIVRWPGVTIPGTVSDIPVMSMDFLPTLLAGAGVAPAAGFAPDGMDIRPALRAEPMPERALFWRYKNFHQRACRLGKWKYLSIGGNDFLFDIVADPMERGNLKAKHPDIFADLKSRWEAWNAKMLPYDAESMSHGFNGSQLADHYGIQPAEH